MKPFFSIIIPVYNAALTIDSCLKSIMAQTFDDFEVLIVDGLSTDNTLKNISDYNAKIRIISEKDEGIYDAMNKGINHALGEWLYFLGSDDILYDEKVLKDVSDFITESTYHLIYGNVKFLKKNIVYDAEFNLHKLLFESNICHQAIFYNHSIFSKVGLYNTKYKVLADYDLNIRCFKHPDFIIRYFERTIALFNDSGISLKYNRDEEPLLKELPMTINEELIRLKDSMDYKVGKFIVTPLRFIKKLFKN